jgi:hypothetical protein
MVIIFSFIIFTYALFGFIIKKVTQVNVVMFSSSSFLIVEVPNKIIQRNIVFFL